MPDIESFISRWSASGGSEQANSQMFLTELCDELGLPHPAPAQAANERNSYAFERKLPVNEGGRTSYRRIDLYKKGCFVLESKQGQEGSEETSLFLPGISRSRAVAHRSRQWEETMDRAKRQAENYVRCIPAPEGRPPFVIVCDVGYCFDVYAEFSRSGGMYLPFPDNRHHRVLLTDFAREDVRVLFQTIWNDPLSLDPSRHAAQVTEAVAAHLAELAVRFERKGVPPERVSGFLMRCIFTMFAEDVGLLPQSSFTDMLEGGLYDPEPLHSFIHDLWQAMNDGTVSLYLRQRLKKFNGSIFSDPEVLPLDTQDVGILLEAARADWKAVEPSIFGTLLERALDPRERHKLGAHYTPRASVERLVLPTIIQPLRAEWENVQAEASMLAEGGDDAAARGVVDDFHDRLCSVRVLDPACGSGNFLYVTLEHMKRLESEVVAEAVRYGGAMLRMEGSTATVGLHQFLGLEVNPRAAYIAEMVLWIGYLQWHFRQFGNVAPPEPIIRRLNNIVCQDAVLAWDEARPAVNPDGTPRTRWDGVTFRDDPVTGRQVPDADAQERDVEYVNPRPAEWPEADFIVGNPPFIGGGVKRRALGDGYVEALASAYPDLPEACDFVMYWWGKAAALVREGKARRFGFISTNTITQVFNRRVTAPFLEGTPPLHLAFAIPDHPWVDSSDGAAVRIAMTVGTREAYDGLLCVVDDEQASSDRERQVRLVERKGEINADLSIGVNLLSCKALNANAGLSFRGIFLNGIGFVVSAEQARSLGLGSIEGIERHIKKYRNGRDITGRCRGIYVIDLFGLAEREVLGRYPQLYQWVYERVKPERDVNPRASRRNNWWIFGEPVSTLRPALKGISRYIATSMTAKHRTFVFLNTDILPDQGLVAITTDDAFVLGVLSSRFHVCWSLAAGGRLGVGNDPRYNNSVCFDPFPFPDATDEQKERIREVAERLDAHRKERQAGHPEMTMTEMYNVLQAMREGRELTGREREINEKGLVTVLKQIHDELDAAVADAYGWPVDAGEQDVLARVVALNAERAEEESRGLVRWLRPEYQNPDAARPAAKPEQASIDVAAPADAAPARKLPWPREMGDQIVAVRQVLQAMAGPIDAASVAARFSRARRGRVEEILGTLERLGLVELPLAG